MNWFFRKGEKKVRWEDGFIGKTGIAISTIPIDNNTTGLITVERGTELFHLYAMTDTIEIPKGEVVEILEF